MVRGHDWAKNRWLWGSGPVKAIACLLGGRLYLDYPTSREPAFPSTLIRQSLECYVLGVAAAPELSMVIIIPLQLLLRCFAAIQLVFISIDSNSALSNRLVSISSD